MLNGNLSVGMKNFISAADKVSFNNKRMKSFLKKVIKFLHKTVRKIREYFKIFSSSKSRDNMNDNQEKENNTTSPNLVRGFCCPYQGCSFGSCQDSLYVDLDNAFFSVVDGVSEGMGQSYFVKLLSRYKTNIDDIRLTPSDAVEIHEKWKEYQEMLIAEGRMPRNTHLLYQEGKYAHSTYIRLKLYSGLSENDNMRWKCAVLGDSALLHIHKSSESLVIKHVILSNDNVRKDNFIYSDIAGYYDFSQAPDQLDEVGTWLANEAYLEGETCEQGDIFILATDHVSAWILEDASNSIERINQLLLVQTQEEFQTLIDKERAENPETGCSNMGDDDSTALIIEILNPKKREFRVTAIIDPREKYEEEKALKKAALELDSKIEDSDESTSTNIDVQPNNDIQD